MCFLATYLQQSSNDRNGEIPEDETSEVHEGFETSLERQTAENVEMLAPTTDDFPTETSDNFSNTEGLA